jgi:hypothetical protein
MASKTDHQSDVIEDVASARVAAHEPGVIEGRVDNMSRRDDSDVLEGHFCFLDLSNAKVKSALKEAGLDDPTPAEGGYGVYLEPASSDKRGYPIDAIVRLRGDSNAKVSVPYSALSPAAAGGR